MSVRKVKVGPSAGFQVVGGARFVERDSAALFTIFNGPLNQSESYSNRVVVNYQESNSVRLSQVTYVPHERRHCSMTYSSSTNNKKSAEESNQLCKRYFTLA